jgi:hypothetical protein
MIGQFSLFDIAPSIEGIDPRKARASYSGDTIATSGKLRTPVQHGGNLWVNTGMQWNKGTVTLELYRLVHPSEFAGETMSYNLKAGIEFGEFARNDPNGFHHGMTAKSGGKSYVLAGPKQILTCASADCERIDGESSADEDDADGAGLYDDEEDGGRTRIGNTPEDEDEEDGEDEDDPGEDVECDCGEVVTRFDPFYATPCGTHCATCMQAHVGVCEICASEFSEVAA